MQYRFSSQYPSYPAAVPRWGTIPSYGMGVPTPYYNVVMLLKSRYSNIQFYSLYLWLIQLCMAYHKNAYYLLQPMPSSQQPSRSRNPFDFGSEQPPVRTPTVRDFCYCRTISSIHNIQTIKNYIILTLSSQKRFEFSHWVLTGGLLLLQSQVQFREDRDFE